MKNINKDIARISEACIHHWIWKTTNWSGGVIKTKFHVDIQLSQVVVFVEHNHFELAIVKIGNIVQNTKFVLRYLVCFDVVALQVLMVFLVEGLCAVLCNDVVLVADHFDGDKS